MEPTDCDGGLFLVNGRATMREPVLCTEPLVKRTEDLITTDVAEAQKGLAAAARDGRLMEAIRIASPSLANEIVKAVAVPHSQLLLGPMQGMLRSVMRYRIRMASRATPFGAFSATSAVCFHGKEEDIVHGRPGDPEFRTVTDARMGWLYEVVRRLEADADVLEHLNVDQHPLALQRGRRVYLPEGGGEGGAFRALTLTPPIQAILNGCASGRTVRGLQEMVSAQFPGITEHAARAAVAKLLAHGFLVSSLWPSHASQRPLGELLMKLGNLPDEVLDHVWLYGRLVEIKALCDAYDRRPFGQGHPALVRLTGAVRNVVSSSTSIHVDLVTDRECALPRAVADEAEAAIELLWRLSADRSSNTAMRYYHREFVERYGTQRLIPVLELLDPARGLDAPYGYRWPPSAARPTRGTSTHPLRGEHEYFLQSIYHRAIRNGLHEIILTKADFPPAVRMAPTLPPPPSCEFRFHLSASSSAALRDGRFVLTAAPLPFVHVAAASSGRFASLIANGVDESRAELRAVMTDDEIALHASLVYQPRTAAAADITRSTTRLAARLDVSALPPHDDVGMRLGLHEVGIAADERLLYAVHMPTGRRLVAIDPTLVQTATEAPNAVRFLHEVAQCAVQAPLPWTWGSLVTAPALPRVRVGRTVLSPRQWRMAQLSLLAKSDCTSAQWQDALARWRLNFRVPEQVIIASEGDQRLAIDLTDESHCCLARDEVRKDGALRVLELPGDGEYYDWVTGRDRSDPGSINGEVREIIVDAVTRRPEVTTPVEATSFGAALPNTTGDRSSVLGGEWLYVKVHTPLAWMDHFIVDELDSFIRSVLTLKVVDRWFFIRHVSDGGPHLRLRFHANDDAMYQKVLPRIGSWVSKCRSRGLVSQASVHEYEPEWERYGGPACQESVELVFTADSEHCLQMLRMRDDNATDIPIDHLAAMTVAALAHSFPEVEAALLSSVRRVSERHLHFRSEHRSDALIWLWLSERSRRSKAEALPERRYDPLIDPANGWLGLVSVKGGQGIRQSLLRLERATRDCGHHVLKSEGSAHWSSREYTILGLIHMSLNRLLPLGDGADVRVLKLARRAMYENDARRYHNGEGTRPRVTTGGSSKGEQSASYKYKA